MSALDRTGRWNPGGGHYLELIEATLVTGYARASRSASPVITLASGASWQKVYCTPGTMGFTLKHEETDNGDMYTASIRGFHPDHDYFIDDAFSGFVSGGRVLVRLKTYGGRTLLFGSPDEPLEFSFQTDSGEDVPDSSGSQLSLSGQFTLPPAYER